MLLHAAIYYYTLVYTTVYYKKLKMLLYAAMYYYVLLQNRPTVDPSLLLYTRIYTVADSHNCRPLTGIEMHTPQESCLLHTYVVIVDFDTNYYRIVPLYTASLDSRARPRKKQVAVAEPRENQVLGFEFQGLMGELKRELAC